MHKYIVFVVLFITINGLNGWPTLEVDTNDIENRDKTCKACTSLVKLIDNMNTNDTNLLQNSLINLCNDYSSLPGKQTTETCKHMTRDLMKMFDKVNKQTFCNEISACGESDSTSGQGLDLQTNHMTDDPNCDFCVTVVTNVKDIISGAPTELEVKYFVEDACHYLGSFENECVSLSDEYIDTLFNFIRQSLQPKKFCQSIGACNTSAKPKQMQTMADISEVVNIFPVGMPLIELKSAKPVEQRTDDMECLICKRIVKLIVQELSDNRTEEAIIQALEKVCSLFPQKERNKCNTFIEQYANELIHILIEEGDPDLACTLLGVCLPNSVWQTINRPNIEREDSVEELKTESNSIKWTEIESPAEEHSLSEPKIEDKKICYECELLMHFIQNEIYDYNNEEQIEEFIEHQLCDRMQIVITKDTCNHFVQQYGPQLFQLIAQKLFDPSTVCQKELGLCANTTQSIQSSQTEPQTDIELSAPTEKCDLCVQLVRQMDSLLENESFDKEVAKIVAKTCHTLPKAQRVECELMVEAFAPYFLQMIGHLSDANQICRSIDMCLTPGHLQLLGGHKCTFGPTYWCHTIAHAESCKATNFCKMKVWKAMP